MGGRGAFVNVKDKNFSFVDNGQTFITVGEVDEIKILVRQKPYSVKAPEYSHTGNRIYAIVQEGKLKHLAFYDDSHRQIKCIDLAHAHGLDKIKPHIHYNLIHNKNESGVPTSESDNELISKINNWLKRN